MNTYLKKKIMVARSKNYIYTLGELLYIFWDT